MDAEFEGNGSDGVAGLSRGAQSAMMLAARNPDKYSAVAAYSGCFLSEGILGQTVLRSIVAGYGGKADNMLGGSLNAGWAAHDLLVNAEPLRGMSIYLFSASGPRSARAVRDARRPRHAGDRRGDRSRHRFLHATAARQACRAEHAGHVRSGQPWYALVAVLGRSACEELADAGRGARAVSLSSRRMCRLFGAVRPSVGYSYRGGTRHRLRFHVATT
ncbi:alpha/beta hydrolase-fold protein [Rhodococcus sp. IEGM 1343]|uniref:alpha/beta hydrolase-fold protein n=1 Tax=Rhodococcus sp. IEGM 1343 TaxID=3082224 RepID=UPI002953AFB5|nr:alpha/beta hydrolase-fold protein [Rhodococcus sp. IEGM 1343]MDV8058409.1 alpha/beta hydrolase-fold protein [Rhodococcus sp. IEGM 1343]